MDTANVMTGAIFMASLSRIIGADEARRYAARFGTLDHPLHANSDILGYEALAFYVYSTGMGWYEQINAELWSRKPSDDVLVFASVLNGALAKLPVYAGNDGVIFRGYEPRDLTQFLPRYAPGEVVTFPAFTSASLREEHAFDGRVLFIIRSLTARVVWYLAADFQEHEVLMPTGCVFQVIEATVVGDRAAILLQELS